MTSTQLRDLLDEATSDIPTSIAQPQLSAIRRRVTRRRTAYSVSGVCTLVAVTAMLMPFLSRPSSAPSPLDTVSPAPTPTLSWHLAEVADDDKSVTLFVDPPGGCQIVKDPKASVGKDQDGNFFVLVVTGTKTRSEDCSRTGGPLVTVQLGEALRGRLLVDGSGGFVRTVVNLREVPKPPAGSGWFQVQRDSLVHDEDTWTFNYTKPGGPDIYLIASGKTFLDLPDDEKINVGSRSVTVRTQGANTFYATWQAQNASFRLMLIPGEGQDLTKQQFIEIVQSLTWP